MASTVFQQSGFDRRSFFALTLAAGFVTELSQNRLMSCEDAPGPRPLLYAGALAGGIMETKTNSLSSQPPQNRNTPIIKERGAARASGWRERGKKLGSGGNAENQLCKYSLSGFFFFERLIITPTVNHIIPP